MKRNAYHAADCPVGYTLDVIGSKWTGLILNELFTGTKRFGELRAALKGISPKTLTERLRIFEKQGIIERKIYAEVPPRVEYSLTDRGRTLKPIIEAMRKWGARSASED
ncbi:MAG: helix-turn-helix transcriptional regulator [Chloroflexi bacterium]|nr:helix-turn-helix transcriptional regulator [Chloroflexota bacterium]